MVGSGEIIEFRRPANLYASTARVSQLARVQAKRCVLRNGSITACCQTKWNNTVSSDVGLSAHGPPPDECPRTLEVHCSMWGRHVGRRGASCSALLAARGVGQKGADRSQAGAKTPSGLHTVLTVISLYEGSFLRSSYLFG